MPVCGSRERYGEAIRIDLVSPLGVPGLLWCPGYAEMVYRAGRKVTDVARVAQLRSERLSHLSAEVWAVFSMAALTGVPREVAVAQVEHLLSLPERVRLHLIPEGEGTGLVGIPGPMMVFTLADGRKVVTSDHLEGSVVHASSVVARAQELVRDALSLAMPPTMSLSALKELL
ncbi:Scr1 family TA system antitoxin-like transcriptional regulator [Nocardiopsis sp. YSL2]|uniref:Scr1 family TA system antitoxin-like transcriptional regulator n=1 Tax=Nocardiopsis sp. YSL2 TaxID=2939492 RepID=UPI0026F41EB4|nr:Scr1 family TA system antitoxin-like transcriptional regulator [Nocardiopsis sp. YSL2]